MKKRYFTITEEELAKVHLFVTDCPTPELSFMVPTIAQVVETQISEGNAIGSIYNTIKLAVFSFMKENGYYIDEVNVAQDIRYAMPQSVPAQETSNEA